MLKITKLIFLLLVATTSFAQQIAEPSGPAEWAKPYESFRVVGNIYHVGTYDLACYLITGSKGHILINTGLAASEAMIKKNIEALGFKMSDIKILLTTQAHFDHTGAMAAIQKSTGAKVMVNSADAAVMEDGGKSDYAFGGDVPTFAPIKVDKVLHNGDTIKLGDTKVVILHHPGHTKGSSSYIMTVDKYRVAIVNMPTIVIAKKFGEVTAYPGIADDYKQTLAALKNLKFDLWLSSHASQFKLHSKRKPGDAYNPEVFRDQPGYEKYLRELEEAYDKKIKM